jgi:hypothetical protein
VQLSLGNLPFSDAGVTETAGFDVVVLDDFIYGEPQALGNAATAVPEPSTYGLIGAGALALAALLRRRRQPSAAAANQV